MRKLKITAIFLLCCISSIFLPSCAREQPSGLQQTQPVTQTELLLDTYCTITVSGTDNSAVLDAAFQICRESEELFSITIEGSDVWRINHAGGEPVAVAQRTIELINRGIEFGRLSDGKFDITIGRLSRLWDFSVNTPQIPDEPQRSAAMQTVDYRQIQISNDTVQLANPEAWIDLGGIAKGYIADEISAYLTGQGIDSALIDLGGDIYALGSKHDGNPWRIGVRKPFGGMDEFIGVLEVTNAAVISSGTYERQFEQDGKLSHHILDPNTAMPAQSDVISATIVAESAVTGEGLATTAILLGSEKIQELFDRSPGFIGAVLVLDDFEVLTFGNIALN